ncbi:MAG: type III-B CRISPR module-associated protein Cmr5 [Candidatus Firestonebacteria bacterium]|nr:type III-B CRISPR module-associated protein Cmr5 [Candidatus Firestonebacteria bacterium]
MAQQLNPETKLTDAGKKLKLKTIEMAEKILPLIKGKKFKKETVNFLKGLPSMIMQNGLGQTIAFLMVKSGNDTDEGKKTKKEYEEILDIFRKIFECSDLMDKIIKAKVKDYLIMQKQAIEYSGWIKKFALAFFEEEEHGTPSAE